MKKKEQTKKLEDSQITSGEAAAPAVEHKHEQIILNKNAVIAAILNLILVGLGYAFLKQYKRAILSLLAYILIYLVIFYVSTFVPILIWLGIPVTLFFAYDAYKRGENSKDFLVKVGG